MASTVWQWIFRTCVAIAGLLIAMGMGYLAAWTAQTANPLRRELLVGSGLALSIGWQFSLLSVAIVSWKHRDFLKRVAWTAYIVFGAISALVLIVAVLHKAPD
jgi:hypothetical protein